MQPRSEADRFRGTETEHRPERPGEVRCVGETCVVRCLGDASTTTEMLDRRDQSQPTRVGPNGHTDFIAEDVCESTDRDPDLFGEHDYIDRALVDERRQSQQGSIDRWMTPPRHGPWNGRVTHGVQDPTNCLLGTRPVLRAQGADDVRHRVSLTASGRSGSVSPELMAGIAFWVDEHDQNMIAIVDERMRAVGFEHYDRATQRTTFTIHDTRQTSMHDQLEGVVRVRTGRTDRAAVEQPPRSERQMTGPARHRAVHPATVVGLDEVVAVNTVVGVLVVGRGCVVGGTVDVSVGCGSAVVVVVVVV